MARRSRIKISKYVRYLSYVLMLVGLFLVVFFISNGGPNKGLGKHLLGSLDNPYLDIQTGLFSMALGLTMLLLSKLSSGNRQSDVALAKMLELEKNFLVFAVAFIIISAGTLLVTIGVFVLYLMIPLIIAVALVSILKYKDILSGKYSAVAIVFIVANWVALLLLIRNITD